MRELLAEVVCDLLRGEVEGLVVFGDEYFVPFLDCGGGCIVDRSVVVVV